jgi:DNA-binding SARP family transcriptional activator
MMPNSLRIQLLGTFQVWRDDVVVGAEEWRGQKARDLLKILLLGRGRFVAKDQLLDWLWPAVDPAQAEASLHSAVSELRHILEPGLARGRDSAFVQTRREGYSFNLDAPVSVDLFAFEQALDRPERANLEAALSRAGELLEEDRYADWAAQERERLHARRLEGYARLTELCQAVGNYSAAAAAAEAGLALDSAREALWRALMLAHNAQGDRAAALRAYDRGRTALARELGTDPAPETAALHQAILTGDSAGAAMRRVDAEQGLGDSVQLTAPVHSRWLAGAAVVGLTLWVVITGGQLLLALAGLLQGSLVGPGDPGAEALPYLQSHPAMLAQIEPGLYGSVPLGLLLLPAYAAWFAALRAGWAADGRRPVPVSPAGWLGVSLGLGEVASQTLSRAISAAQMAVLPRAYADSPAQAQAAYIALWDVLRQLASIFATLSVVAQPLAIGALSLATLAAFHSGGRPRLRWPQAQAWTGLILAGLNLVYTFVPPSITWGSLLLPLGLALAMLTDGWLIALAAAFWP